MPAKELIVGIPDFYAKVNDFDVKGGRRERQGLQGLSPVTSPCRPYRLHRGIRAPASVAGADGQGLVRIAGLQKIYKTRDGNDIHALKDINLEIRDGRVHQHRRAERMRQDHAAEDPGRHSASDRR